VNPCGLALRITGMSQFKRMAALVGLTALILVGTATPADAWSTGTFLRTGDTVCSVQAQSDLGARYVATILNGTGTITIRTATTAGGPETTVFSKSGLNVGADRSVTAAPGTYFRGCATITSHTSNTWVQHFLFPTGPFASDNVSTASLSVGSTACAGGALGDVRLLGTGTGQVSWSIRALDIDYAEVGPVFAIMGSTVDTTFHPGPELTLLKMCATNISSGRLSVSFTLSAG